MKTLMLLRHAKSSWDQPGLRDHQRPLASRGRRDAPRMGDWLAANDRVPDVVVCSTSARTRETWELVAAQLPNAVPVEFSDDLYHAGSGGLLRAARGGPAGAESLMLIGHNPGMEAAAAMLTGTDASGALHRMEEKFPTCALAVLEFDVDRWADIAPDGGCLVRFVRPRDL